MSVQKSTGSIRDNIMFFAMAKNLVDGPAFYVPTARARTTCSPAVNSGSTTGQVPAAVFHPSFGSKDAAGNITGKPEEP
ncbi:MAG: hypothetical protein FWF02_14485 [Micrococcales bacterium]|nr:hypothetical protein [Micrococcales bacterium]MCL2668885.1 hypothetical protein [Micrococcales bacterium]